MALLGWCYKCGKGVEKDDAQAYEWYRKSAEAGDEIGMGLLRLCYEHGTGVEKFEQKSSITTTIPQNNYNEPVFKEEPVKKVHPELSEQYSFENFISSDENAYVFNAALAVSKNPGIAYNPLLIYGGVGLGKTHLMKAIGYSIFQSTHKCQQCLSGRFGQVLPLFEHLCRLPFCYPGRALLCCRIRQFGKRLATAALPRRTRHRSLFRGSRWYTWSDSVKRIRADSN